MKFLLICLALIGVASNVAAQQIQIDDSRITRGIIGATNEYRTAKGVPALTVSEPLMRAAQQYAEYQARTNTSGHTADGRSPDQRMLASGYKFCAGAENVYEQWSTPTLANPVVARGNAMSFWNASPGHEANLRNARVRHIGVGAAAWTHGGKHYYKIVQMFGDDCGQSAAKPSSACPPGYVPRLARATDTVCVTPASRTLVAEENRNAPSRVQPGGGAYGPNTCRMGFVWREAFYGDGVCVTPERRTAVRIENQQASLTELVNGSRIRF